MKFLTAHIEPLTQGTLGTHNEAVIDHWLWTPNKRTRSAGFDRNSQQVRAQRFAVKTGAGRRSLARHYFPMLGSIDATLREFVVPWKITAKPRPEWQELDRHAPAQLAFIKDDLIKCWADFARTTVAIAELAHLGSLDANTSTLIREAADGAWDGQLALKCATHHLTLFPEPVTRAGQTLSDRLASTYAMTKTVRDGLSLLEPRP